MKIEEKEEVRNEAVDVVSEVNLDTEHGIETEILNKKEVVEKEEINEEYVTYHVHVVSSKDSIESIMKTYNVNMDLLKEYNDIKELKIGDKVLIPDYTDE
jgi:LysM repeat protein